MNFFTAESILRKLGYFRIEYSLESKYYIRYRNSFEILNGNFREGMTVYATNPNEAVINAAIFLTSMKPILIQGSGYTTSKLQWNDMLQNFYNV